ncbi:MAG: hypothetical protein QNJ44_19765 [Rhodobacter sp.]|nr:hypothetical protein [Rhodobacter sp.]
MTSLDQRPLHLDTADITSKLAQIVVDSIGIPDKWGDVLDFIIDNTNACAAIITLRDKNTCQIVNDRNLEQDYHSPLIRGFSLEAVGFYLTELRTIDPWAKVQKQYYPHRPTLMSNVCPPEDYPNNRFFKWLRGQNMEDTVVFELDHMAGYWTACNLFLPNRDRNEAIELLNFSNAHFDLLRSAWKSSQTLQRSRQTGQALFDQIGTAGRACALVGPNGEFREGNTEFDALKNADNIRLSGPAKRVRFPEAMAIYGLSRWEDFPLSRYEGPEDVGHVFARPIAPDPRFEGKRETLWLLEFVRPSEPEKAPYDLRVLTDRELALYQAVTEGASVETAGASVGLGRTRAFEVWNSVKSKLGITSAHKLR